MDVRVEAGTLTAGAVIVESKTIVEVVLVHLTTPVVSSLSLAPTIIEIGGHSISSINPELTRIGVLAAA